MAQTFACSACGSPIGTPCVNPSFCRQCRRADARLREENDRRWKEAEETYKRVDSILDALYENAEDVDTSVPQ